MTHTVEILRAPATTAAVTRFHVDYEAIRTIGERMGPAFETVAARLGEADIAPAGPPVAYYDPSADGFDVAAGFRVAAPFTAPPGLERLDVEPRDVAHTTHVGSYAELQTAYRDLETEVEGQGRSLAWEGPMWEEYVSPHDAPEDETRTEVYWPVAGSE
jgi:effector-binding domain-containing protein